MRKGKLFLVLVLLAATLLGSNLGAGIAQESTPQSDVPTETDGEDLWSLEEAAYYASFEIRDFPLVDDTFQSWKGATIGTITLVMDATGDPVLYDVIVENDDQPVGLVQIWAKKSMGMPFHTVSASTTLIDLSLQTTEAHEIAIRELGDIEVIETEMVYYAYPKRAFALTFRRNDMGNMIDQVLVDVTIQRIVSPDEVIPFAEMLNEDNLRESTQRWEVMREHLDERVESSPGIRVLDVPLYGQANGCYCVPATAKMIHQYRTGWSPSQDSLANTFNFHWSAPCGVDGEDIVPGWAELGFSATWGFGKAPFWRVQYEIDHNYPFMSIIPWGAGTHYRDIVGYVSFGGGDEGALINDPLPVNAGYQYWEHRTSSLETWYVKVH